MEHPRAPQDPDKVSVWRLACHRDWIMQLPDAVEHNIEQWRYGSAGVKPTTLRALNMGDPAIVARIFASEVDPLAIKPCNPLCGKAHDGTYRTAAAKEYPSGLCRTLVLATVTSIQYRLRTFGWVQGETLSEAEHEWVNTLYHSACHATLSGTFLPDFQG